MISAPSLFRKHRAEVVCDARRRLVSEKVEKSFRRFCSSRRVLARDSAACGLNLKRDHQPAPGRILYLEAVRAAVKLFEARPSVREPESFPRVRCLSSCDGRKPRPVVLGLYTQRTVVAFRGNFEVACGAV